MSGGPQVFLGATTFYLISGCRQISGRREALPLGAGLLVAPRVFRAPEAPAAREARRPHFVRRRASKPARALRSLRRPPHQWGQAPPPPTGTAARPRRPRDDRLLNNVARNSLACVSNVDVASLELQRFERESKTDRCKLRATFARGYVVAAAHRQRDPAQRDPARRLNCAPKLGRV